MGFPSRVPGRLLRRWYLFPERVCFFVSILATSFPKDMPTDATSRLCVSRLCTKMLPGSGNTCVLFCSLRNGAEKMSLS